MKKVTLIILALATSFCFGFAFKSIITNQANDQAKMKRVTGIGGIFFKCKDPKKMKDWYQTHLGLNTNQYGAVFEWWQGADSTKKGFTQWSLFKETTKYFEPSTKDFMINYRVENLEALVSMETVDYGNFVHIMDIEGNKIELWEPNDIEFENLGKKTGAMTTK